MRKKIEFKWEMIDETNEGKFQTLRAKVMGGWLIQTVMQEMKLKILTSSITFVPDRDHEWHILPAVKAEEAPVKAPSKADDFAPK